jgi:hypothetical protein
VLGGPAADTGAAALGDAGTEGAGRTGRLGRAAAGAGAFPAALTPAGGPAQSQVTAGPQVPASCSGSAGCAAAASSAAPAGCAAVCVFGAGGAAWER